MKYSELLTHFSFQLAGFFSIHIIRNFLSPFYVMVFFGPAEDYPTGFQMLMWIPFFLALSILFIRYRKYKKARSFMEAIPYSGDESMIYDANDLSQIILRIKPHKEVPEAFGPKIVHQVILKYQASRSSEQASSMLSSLLDLKSSEVDSGFSMVKYLSWLMPSLGFLGTVYGISLAVTEVGSARPDDPDLLKNIALNLGIAFNTTLAALVQSSFVIWITNVLEGYEERLLNDLGQDVLGKLINRLA